MGYSDYYVRSKLAKDQESSDQIEQQRQTNNGATTSNTSFNPAQFGAQVGANYGMYRALRPAEQASTSGTDATAATMGTDIGADTITASSAAEVPAGYEVIGQNMDGSVMAMPTGPNILGSTLGTAGLGVAASVANAAARREFSDRGNTMNTAYNASQAMSPINQFQSLTSNIGNIRNGQRIDTASQAALALPTAGLSLIYNDVFASGKDKDQQLRDRVRGVLQENGILDDKYQLTLPDGSTFDMGKDGGATMENGMSPYNIDLELLRDQKYQDMVADINVVGHLMTGLSDDHAKPASDFTGYLFNALNQNRGNYSSNIRGLYDQMGGFNQIQDAISRAHDEGKITTDKARAFLNSLTRVYGHQAHYNAKQ